MSKPKGKLIRVNIKGRAFCCCTRFMHPFKSNANLQSIHWAIPIPDTIPVIQDAMRNWGKPFSDAQNHIWQPRHRKTRVLHTGLSLPHPSGWDVSQSLYRTIQCFANVFIDKKCYCTITHILSSAGYLLTIASLAVSSRCSSFQGQPFGSHTARVQLPWSPASQTCHPYLCQHKGCLAGPLCRLWRKVSKYCWLGCQASQNPNRA